MALDFWTVHYSELLKSGKQFEDFDSEDDFDIDQIEAEFAAMAKARGEIPDQEIEQIINESTNDDWEEVA